MLKYSESMCALEAVVRSHVSTDINWNVRQIWEQLNCQVIWGGSAKDSSGVHCEQLKCHLTWAFCLKVKGRTRSLSRWWADWTSFPWSWQVGMATTISWRLQICRRTRRTEDSVMVLVLMALVLMVFVLRDLKLVLIFQLMFSRSLSWFFRWFFGRSWFWWFWFC